MMKPLVLLACLGSAALVACSDDTPTDPQHQGDSVVCTAEARAGISVTVVDSLTGQAIPTAPTVVAKQGAFADTSYHFSSPSTGPYALVYERPGIYTVAVSAAGYKPWQAENIVVAKGTCHVSTVLLTARLQK